MIRQLLILLSLFWIVPAHAQSIPALEEHGQEIRDFMSQNWFETSNLAAKRGYMSDIEPPRYYGFFDTDNGVFLDYFTPTADQAQRRLNNELNQDIPDPRLRIYDADRPNARHLRLNYPETKYRLKQYIVERRAYEQEYARREPYRQLNSLLIEASYLQIDIKRKITNSRVHSVNLSDERLNNISKSNGEKTTQLRELLEKALVLQRTIRGIDSFRVLSPGKKCSFLFGN